MTIKIHTSQDIAYSDAPREGFIQWPKFEGRTLSCEYIYLKNGFIRAFINSIDFGYNVKVVDNENVLEPVFIKDMADIPDYIGA